MKQYIAWIEINQITIFSMRRATALMSVSCCSTSATSGINAGESSEQAMWRELFEETGLRPADVTLLGETADWLYYRLPVRYRRKRRPGMVQCIGQKQKWFLLRLESGDPAVNLNASSQPPEFDDWCWIDYYAPPGEVVHFKRKVYKQALDSCRRTCRSASRCRPRRHRRYARRASVTRRHRLPRSFRIGSPGDGVFSLCNVCYVLQAF